MRVARVVFVAALLSGGAAFSGVTAKVPVDVGIGPGAWWFTGRLLENRGAIPHFGIVININAVIDQAVIRDNQDKIPNQYKQYAANITELRVGASIFIPSAIYISPKVDALNGVGLYGVSWEPLGLTLINTGTTSSRDWNKTSRGKFYLETNLLLTYLFIHSDFPLIPTTHFLRPGLNLKTELLVAVTKGFLISLGGAAEVYIPQRLGSFFEVSPFEDLMWFAAHAFLKFHARFPYEVSL